MSLSSGLTWQDWETENLSRVWGRKAEGKGANQREGIWAKDQLTKNRAPRPKTTPTLH
jgi:hypothetical protein